MDYFQVTAMAAKKEQQKVIDVGSVEILALSFRDEEGELHYYGDAEHVFSLRLTEADQAFLKVCKVKE